MPTIEIFRGIPYARANRFQAAQIEPFDGRFVDRPRGPICPQPTNALEFVMGRQAEMRQSEHCQVLSIFTPGRSGRRPVLVFLHGGGFLVGGGELPWYDGDKLASEQDVVVVTITHRLGVLGYLRPPGHEGPSFATGDQVAALSWLAQHIEAFGGDPGNVTLFGWSSGASSIANLLAWGYGDLLFHRAILQSPPSGASRDAGRAAALSQHFVETLGADPRTVDLDRLMSAQAAFHAVSGEVRTWTPVLPSQSRETAVDAIAGWTHDDALPFVMLRHAIKPQRGDVERYEGETQMANAGFIDGCHEIAARMSAGGRKAFQYQFGWGAPDSGLGACHGIDLPFLLGSEAAWSGAPMLGSAAWDDIETRGRSLRAAWAAFARSGEPGAQWRSDAVNVIR